MNEQAQTPTLKTIAKIAGVSEATVSRALNKHPSQSKATNERIQKIAKEVGYVRHPYVTALMRNMRQGHTVRENPTIALVHCLPASYYPNPIMSELSDGASQQAKSLRFNIDNLYLKKRGMSPERLYSILINRGVRGIIFEHVADGDIPLSFDLSRFACVTTQFAHGLPFLHKVTVNVYDNLLASLDECLNRGYRRIGLLLSKEQEINNHYQRRAAFKAAQDKFAKEANLYIREPNNQSEFDIKSWIQRNGIQVVLGSHSQTSDQILASGLKIPEDVSYLNLDAYETEPHDLTGMRAGWKEVGKTVINQVVDQLIRNEYGIPEHPIRTTVAGKWHEGFTLPNLNDSENKQPKWENLEKTILSQR